MSYESKSCRSCDGDVSPGATECPHCGEPHPASNVQLVLAFVGWTAVAIGLLIILGSIVTA